MDRLKTVLFAALGLAFLQGSPAFADGITLVNFSDTHTYWLQGQAGDWHNGNSGYGYVDDNLDFIGTPNFLNGSIGIDNNHLVSLTVRYTNGSGLEKIGDLFIDANSDNYWDYVVKLYNVPGVANGNAGMYSVYSTHLDARKSTNPADNNSRYYLSGNDNTGIWAGYVIRDDSPFAAREAVLGDNLGSVSFSGWDTQWGPNSSSFDFGNLIDLAGSTMLTFAWDPNCANDMLWEQIPIDTTVTPEPSSLLLLGTGMGLIGWRKWKKRAAVAPIR